jgi:hypothetical protein
MLRRLSLIVVVVAMLGCTAPVVKIPIGQAALTYGDFKYLQAALTLRIGDMCTRKKLSEVDCVWMQGEREKLDMVDKQIRASVMDAKGEIDQEKVMQYLQILAGIAMKVGGL